MDEDAWLILLMRIICLIIIGARKERTPKPQHTMNGNHGMPVPACREIRAAAVALNTGAPHAQMNGSEYVFTGLIAAYDAASVAAVIDSAIAAASACASCSAMTFYRSSSMSGFWSI